MTSSSPIPPKERDLMHDRMLLVLLAIILGTAVYYLLLRWKVRNYRQEEDTDFSYRCPKCRVTYESPGSCPACNSDLQLFSLTYDVNAVTTLNDFLNAFQDCIHDELENEAVRKGTEIISQLDAEEVILRMFHKDPRIFLKWTMPE